GRQIDVVTRGLPTTFQNNDRYIGLEVDFPPSLDQEFGVTTHKQQITLSERVMDLLSENEVWSTLRQMRKRWAEWNADLESEFDPPDPEAKRPSEQAMEDSAPLDPVAPESERRSQQAEEGREEAVKDLVDKGVPTEEAKRVVESVEKERPFRV